jgi:hypothetical protein
MLSDAFDNAAAEIKAAITGAISSALGGGPKVLVVCHDAEDRARLVWRILKDNPGTCASIGLCVLAGAVRFCVGGPPFNRFREVRVEKGYYAVVGKRVAIGDGA